MKRRILAFAWMVMLQLTGLRFAVAEEIYMSYPGLTGESAPLWIARETLIFKDYGIDAKLFYMEGGRLSIQSLLSGTTQFMTGDAVSALSAIAGGADIVLLASAKNVLPYVFAVAKDVRRPADLKGKIIATSQIGGRAGEIARMVIRNMGLGSRQRCHLSCRGRDHVATRGSWDRQSSCGADFSRRSSHRGRAWPEHYANRVYSFDYRRSLDLPKIRR